MWSILAAIHITFLYFGIDVALIYLIGVAGEAVIVLWSFIKKPKIKRPAEDVNSSEAPDGSESSESADGE